MVFSSQAFLFGFLPVALALYYAVVRGPRWLVHGTLIGLSYAFYASWNPPFVLLMLASTAIDWMCGRVIAYGGPEAREAREVAGSEPPLLREGGARTRRQHGALAVSVIANLSILGFFKYFNFGVDSYNELTRALGIAAPVWQDVMRVTLPLGISFYTFQSMSYTIDVYRGHARATRSPIDFACYVSLFTQLVAGPILRFSQVADQLVSRTHTLEKFGRGVALFSLGLAKKVMLANPCGRVADACFDAGSLSTLDAWFGALAYTFQIYFDFSGYSDMAIGLGLMLGFVFPKNFDAPYRSASLTEFWQRWHISLSTWLRDYLYIPLGGNRRGPGRTYANLMIVMLLGGLWHGAAATFVAWGALHGVGLGVERALGRRPVYARLPHGLRVAVTFLLVMLGWVFFRAADLPSAIAYLGRMFGAGSTHASGSLLPGVLYDPYSLATLAVAGLIVARAPTAWDWTRTLSPARAAVCLLLFGVAASLLFTQAYNPFIYFTF